jgi:hypothetical protein
MQSAVYSQTRYDGMEVRYMVSLVIEERSMVLYAFKMRDSTFAGGVEVPGNPDIPTVPTVEFPNWAKPTNPLPSDSRDSSFTSLFSL